MRVMTSRLLLALLLGVCLTSTAAAQRLVFSSQNLIVVSLQSADSHSCVCHDARSNPQVLIC